MQKVESVSEVIVSDNDGLSEVEYGDSSVNESSTEDLSEARTVTLRLKMAFEKLETTNLDIAPLLYEANEKEYHTAMGYSDFKSYIVEEFSCQERKAYYLIEVHRKLGVWMRIDRSALKAAGWTKCKEVCKLVDDENSDRSEIASWVDRAAYTSFRELAKQIEEEKARLKEEKLEEIREGIDEAGEGMEEYTDDLKNWSCKVSCEQKQMIEMAMTIAEKVSNSDKKGMNLFVICSEFVNSNRELLEDS